MNRSLWIRSVPPEIHGKVRIRAAAEGMTLSAWLLRVVAAALERPSRREVLRRIQAVLVSSPTPTRPKLSGRSAVLCDRSRPAVPRRIGWACGSRTAAHAPESAASDTIRGS